ncbi:hypothetical protein Pmani_031127 [Petrolisthes manimaculis]|uniref:Uncharacterized protein n=1 Tax=Petrolisthes manimaculis TaxID=1843537 RepID=A0AAE1NUA1_9EUCA|nr:hypothetical protein Pmani_031127 [Petrolisthes manimaculis]
MVSLCVTVNASLFRFTTSLSKPPSLPQDDGGLEEGEGDGAINLSARPSRQTSPLDQDQCHMVEREGDIKPVT